MLISRKGQWLTSTSYKKAGWLTSTEKSSVVDVDGTFHDQLYGKKFSRISAVNQQKNALVDVDGCLFSVNSRQPFSSRPI